MKDLFSKFKECQEAEYTHVANDGSFAIKRKGNRLTILFEWSNGKKDWINNFRFIAVPTKPYKNMTEGIWFCHRGFDKVWKSIEPYISKEIYESNITNADIIGYSHGGAIAQLCYEYIKYNRPDIEVSGVGFGAPRVLWGFARKSVKERFKGFQIIRNGSDIVTHLPPVIFGFIHVGEVVKVGKGKRPIKDHTPKRYRETLQKIADSEAD